MSLFRSEPLTGVGVKERQTEEDDTCRKHEYVHVECSLPAMRPPSFHLKSRSSDVADAPANRSGLAVVT
jgi:hypothetical protein